MTGNKWVDAIGTLPFSGNVIPNNWFQLPQFRYENGKVNLLSIVILADILYWYRPTEVIDEATGKTVCWTKKFSSDKLQRKYSALVEKFGCSKRQAIESCHFLKRAGLITLEFRTVNELSNVLFIAPVIEAISILWKTPPPTSQCVTSNITVCDLTHHSVLPHTSQCVTYTKTTTKTTTKNKNSVQKTHANLNKKNGEISHENEKENLDMEAKGTLINFKENKNPPSLEFCWLDGLALLKSKLGEKVYLKKLSLKEKAQLKQLGEQLKDRKFEVVNWCITNWDKFSGHAASCAGLLSHPTQHHIGFMLAHHAHAVNYIDSLKYAKPNIVLKPIALTVLEEIDDDDIPYKPSLEELQKYLG